ncbi:MAG: MiaB/RimO family radical SAM methylthiotransferase [bacterium]
MTIAFKIFGCRLNQTEGAGFITQFEAAGFERIPLGDGADVILVYSCTVTQKAENECVKTLRHLRVTQPHAMIVLAGCAAETCDRDALKGVVDLFVSREQKDDLVALIGKHLGKGGGRREEGGGKLQPRLSTQRATLKVQDGCAFRCSYCIVPHARGEPRSRSIDACLVEAQSYMNAGFQELVITGCNTACYVDGNRNLIDLLKACLDLKGVGRIRLGSIEPGTVERDLIDLMALDARVCRFLHLPIQSGCDTTLTRMKRRYTMATIRETLEYALEKVPDLGLGTDMIVGFPGERQEDFEQTWQLIKDYPFANVHVFPYSERPGTPAALMNNKIPIAERKRRAKELSKIAESQRAVYLYRFLGKEVTFLVEHIDRAGRACGWSSEYLPCAVHGLSVTTRRTLQTFKVKSVVDGTLEG